MIRRAPFLMLVFFAAGNLQAADLVVMATNTTAVPGDKVYTVGVQVTQAEVDAVAAQFGNVVLGIQELAFQGNVANLQQTTPYNPTQLQNIQSQYIDPAAAANPVAPGFGAGPPGDLGSAGNAALYGGSFWYFGSTGRLVGANDSTGNPGTITTSPAADGSGVYTVGPTNNVGASGGLWQPFFANTPETPQPAGMSLINAFYGGIGPGSYINDPPFTSSYFGGVLTVPLAQIVASGDVTIPYQLTNPLINGGQAFIVVGQTTNNVLGGSALVDPHAVLDFSTNTIRSELSSGGGIGSVGGVQVSPSMISAGGTLSSSFATTTLAALGQAIGAGAAQQVNFALPGPTVQAWDIQYTGTLQGSSTVVFHYDPTQIGSTPESELRIEHYENGQWVVPAGQIVDTTAHTITFQTDGFSPFVLSQVPEPASGVLLGLGALAMLGWRRTAGRE
jgi:PEP-CTERM motif